MEHEQYIGKPLKGCPDGTVALIADDEGDLQAVTWTGGECYFTQLSEGEFSLGDDRADWSGNTVTHILKLGNPRPKTLADEEPGVVWRDNDGFVFWRDDFGDICYMNGRHPYPKACAEEASSRILTSGYTRLGQITGLVIDGEIYPND